MRRLTGIAFSPWSERAKWALDHHRLDYEYDEYVPLLGEYILRARMHLPSGFVTVPVMRTDNLWLTDSLDIAKWAERNGSGAPLFPEAQVREIEKWNLRSDTALSAGRALAVVVAASDPNTSAALIPKPLRSILGPLAQKGLEALIAKHRMREDMDQHESTVIDVLTEFESALGGRSYLIDDRFSYADIAMAMAVQFVVPVDRSYMPSGPPGVKWTENTRLVHRFPGLVAWRDALYAKHRRTS